MHAAAGWMDGWVGVIGWHARQAHQPALDSLGGCPQGDGGSGREVLDRLRSMGLEGDSKMSN